MAVEERAVLIEGLVKSLASGGIQNEQLSAPRARKLALATIQDFRGSRINHFAVKDSLIGLQERADIYGRNDLATALNAAVAKAEDLLQPFMPECLSLLLHLADHPIERTEVGNLELLCREPESQPSWTDILRDEPLDNTEGVWDNVDFGADSTIESEDISLRSDSLLSNSNPSSLNSNHEQQSYPADFVAVEEDVGVEELIALRERWIEIYKATDKDLWAISEQQVIREVIFMLHGDESDLFLVRDERIIPRQNITLQHVSQELFKSVLMQFGLLGTRISELRKFTRKLTQAPVVQSFQSALATEIRQFDSTLANVESRSKSFKHAASTLIDIFADIRGACKFLLTFGYILKESKNGMRPELAILECLYDLGIKQQSLGNAEVYDVTCRTFQTCFKIYLRTIRSWVVLGEVVENSDDSVVKRCKELVSSADMWSSSFEFTCDEDGRCRLPGFLMRYADKILSTGKSISFVQALCHEQPNIVEQEFDLYSAYDSAVTWDLIPFSQRFHQSFEAWINPIQAQVASILNIVLKTKSNLENSIRALLELYLGQNGPALDHIADAILENQDAISRSLHNPLILLRIYHEAFSAADFVTDDGISVVNHEKHIQPSMDSKLSSVLQKIVISYRLPWAVSNIVSVSSLKTYRMAHSLILHTRIAKRAVDEKFHQKTIRNGYGSKRDIIVALRLLHRLRWFTHTLQSYLLGTAIQGSMLPLLQEIKKPGGLDDKIQSNLEFVRHIERRMLLDTSANRSYQTIGSSLDLVIATAAYLKSQWPFMCSPQSTTTAESSETKEEPGNYVDGLEARLLRLTSFSSTYEKFLGFLFDAVQDCARTTGDRCLHIFADSLSYGLSQAPTAR